MRRVLRNLVVLGLLILLAVVPSVQAANKWYVYENCQFLPGEYHDGDSFHVKHGRRREIFRLNFVDCPETDDSLKDRMAEQAAYWNIPETRIHALGEEATRFTASFLAETFTVHTQRDDARGNSDRERFYGIVIKGELDLAEELVRAGLARIYGRMVDLPDGTPGEKVQARLRKAEREAKAAGRGAWAQKPGGKLPSGRAPAPAVAAAAVIARGDLVLARPLAIYSLKTGLYVGTLKAGTTIGVLGAASPGMVHIRFGQQDKLYEAKCQLSDLGGLKDVDLPAN